MSSTYYIRIKKDYAASVIEDLEKMEAIELIDEGDVSQIPQWQMKEVNRRIEKYQDRSELLIGEEDVFKILDAE